MRSEARTESTYNTSLQASCSGLRLGPFGAAPGRVLIADYSSGPRSGKKDFSAHKQLWLRAFSCDGLHAEEIQFATQIQLIAFNDFVLEAHHQFVEESI